MCKHSKRKRSVISPSHPPSLLPFPPSRSLRTCVLVPSVPNTSIPPPPRPPNTEAPPTATPARKTDGKGGKPRRDGGRGGGTRGLGLVGRGGWFGPGGRGRGREGGGGRRREGGRERQWRRGGPGAKGMGSDEGVGEEGGRRHVQRRRPDCGRGEGGCRFLFSAPWLGFLLRGGDCAALRISVAATAYPPCPIHLL